LNRQGAKAPSRNAKEQFFLVPWRFWSFGALAIQSLATTWIFETKSFLQAPSAPAELAAFLRERREPES
jgi:hypothetical protein